MGVRILTFIFFSAFIILLLHTFKIQIIKHDYYVEKVTAREIGTEQSSIKRGQINITDKNDNIIPVAINKEYPIIYAVPQQIKEDFSISQKLADVLEISSSSILKKLENKKSLFRILVEKPAETVLNKVKELNLEGIYRGTKNYREYPYKNLAAQTIGYLGFNDRSVLPVGMYGIEKYYNDELEKGNDIQLTIDRNIQAKSEEIIEELIKEQNAEGGEVIVQNPQTGEILTMASYPNFDPNKYSEHNVKLFSNPAVEKLYEPGSVFKPLTMAIGINNKIFTPTTTYNDLGYVVLNGKKITNWNHKAYGSKTTMTNVIENSINTGAVWAEQKIGKKLFYEGIKKFGFGEPTKIDLPNEVSGNLSNIEKKDAQDIDYATVSFGQGISVTSIQMINAFSAIANGGLLMRPYLNKNLKPYIIRRVIEEETAKQVIEMMKSAVDKAKIATILQFQIAGKTGTAQIPKQSGGGYYEDLYIHTFIGILPASNPKYVILIKLMKPKSELAALSVVPGFKKLATFILNYSNIKPDDVNL